MPYRIDITDPPAETLDELVGLGALDVETSDGGLAALLPDHVALDVVTAALGGRTVTVSPAVGRDDESVWRLSPQPVRVGRIVIVPEGGPAPPDAIRLIDAAAFGTGLHPTTALCLEILDDMLEADIPASVLDVGTGSGILALAALRRGVPHAVGLDVDADALDAATANARLNGLDSRLTLVHGGPDALGGTWPLVLANVQAAPLMEMAPRLVRHLAHGARLVLSGIPASAADEVERVYCRLGLFALERRARGGWVALVLQVSW